MNTPVIPESAPFTAEQRAWLNGFFAGILNLDGTNATATNQALPSSEPSRDAIAPHEADDFPWHDPALPLNDRLELAEGRPIEHRLMAAMAQLDCGACGYVCQTYSAAIARGDEADVTKCTPGGMDTVKTLKRLLAERTVGNEMRPQAVPHVNGSSNGHANGKRGFTGGSHKRSATVSARLLRTSRLTHDEAPKDTRHVEIDLEGTDLEYQPGDALGILPLNCDELVTNVIAVLGAENHPSVRTKQNLTCTLRDYLKREVTLSRGRPPLLELLAGHAQNSQEAETLRGALTADDDSLRSLDVAELLERFPTARPPVDEFLKALAPLQPRLYSISSSPRAHPKQVHLTVGVVRFQSSGRWRYGVASHFLGVRSQPGDELSVFVQSSPRFHLPADPNTPIIMVGPGTGIAPFRAFLEEREAIGAKGKNWLFFGNQYMGYDYLYREQIERWYDDRLLTRLDLAFSRDKAEKVYVQHRMLEHGAEIWRWLEEGAHFYVCGDAKRMAVDVDRALITIVETYGGLTPESAKGYVRELSKSQRYHKDVY